VSFRDWHHARLLSTAVSIAATMIPAGYMAKRVVDRPDWLAAERVTSIYSVSGCVSENFTDYIPFWKHNGYWLFDSPEIIIAIARENEIDLAEAVLFFYEVYDLQFDSRGWTRFEPEASFGTHVSVPDAKCSKGTTSLPSTCRHRLSVRPCRATLWQLRLKRTPAVCCSPSTKRGRWSRVGSSMTQSLDRTGFSPCTRLLGRSPLELERER
jgi:hypothetical protein